MNETMIDRVAKALYESDCPYLWEEATEKDKKWANIHAHTAIKAMKEPTQRMIDAADLEELKNGPELTAFIYTKSIEAALSEGEGA